MAWLKQRDNGYYYIYWYEGQTKAGKPKKCMKSLKTKNAQRARYVFKSLEEKVYLRKQGIYSLDRIDIQAFMPRLDSYLNTHFENKYTRKKYLGHYRLFVGFLSKRFKHVTYLHEVDSVHLIEFKMYEQDRDKSPHSINSEIKSLHKVFKIASELNHINTNPVSGLSIIRTKKPPIQVYSQDEIRIMFKYSKENHILDSIILLLLQTGARRQEVINFKWTDFNKENRTLRVSIKENWNPKFCKERILRLSDRLAEMIDKLERKSEYIFTQEGLYSKGRKFSGSQFKRFIIRDFVKRLGINGHIHKFRDTYASYSIACGVDIAKVQDRLGHESLRETDRYAKAINESIDDDIKSVFVGDNGELKNK